MKRTTVLLDDKSLEQLRRRAIRRGTTVTEEVREAVENVLRAEEEVDTSRWLMELVDAVDAMGPPRPGPRVDVDSDEGKLQAARDIYRDSMNREPDF